MEQITSSAHETETDSHDAWFRQEVMRTLAKRPCGEAHFSGHEEVFQQLKQYARQRAASARSRMECAHDGQLA